METTGSLMNVVDVIKEEPEVMEEDFSEDQFTEESTVTIAKGEFDLADSVMEESDPTVAKTKKPLYNRKLPKKKGRRKRFYRRKTHRTKVQNEMAVLIPEVTLTVKDEKFISVEPTDVSSHCNYEQDEQHNICKDESLRTSVQDTLKPSSVLVIKQEPSTSAEETNILKPLTQDSTVRVQKVLLQKHTKKTGITVFTPVLTSTSKIKVVNPLFKKNVQKHLTLYNQQEIVTENPKTDHAYFKNEPKDCQETSEGSFVSMSEPVKNVSNNSPVPADVTLAETTSEPQPQNIATTSIVSQEGKTQTLSIVAQSGKTPELSLVAQPGNIQKFCLLSQHGNTKKFSLVPQSGSFPKTRVVAVPGNFPLVPQSQNIPKASILAVPGNILVSQSGSIPKSSTVAVPGNTTEFPLVPQSQSIPTTFLVAKPENILAVPHMVKPGTDLPVSQTTPGNIPASSQVPKNSVGNPLNGTDSPDNKMAAEHTENPSTAEHLLEEVRKKLNETLPASWITVLRPNGIALCLLNHDDIVTIRRSLFVEVTGKVTVGVHGKELPPENPYWQYIKDKTVELRNDNTEEFVKNVRQLHSLFRGMEVCRAVEEFQPFWKNMENCEIDGNRFHEIRCGVCCRSNSCHLLVPNLRNKRCVECSKIWKVLNRRSLVDSRKPEGLSLRKPYKYLTSPERRERFDRAVRDIRSLRMMNRRLTEKLNQILNPEDGVPADSVVDNAVIVDTDMADDNSENEL